MRCVCVDVPEWRTTHEQHSAQISNKNRFDARTSVRIKCVATRERNTHIRRRVFVFFLFGLHPWTFVLACSCILLCVCVCAHLHCCTQFCSVLFAGRIGVRVHEAYVLATTTTLGSCANRSHALMPKYSRPTGRAPQLDLSGDAHMRSHASLPPGPHCARYKRTTAGVRACVRTRVRACAIHVFVREARARPISRHYIRAHSYNRIYGLCVVCVRACVSLR